MKMSHSYTETHPLHHDDESTTPQPAPGAWLSIAGLIAWLGAMALAVAGPLLDIDIPAGVIVGMVIFSGVFSLLSLPRLLSTPTDDD